MSKRARRRRRRRRGRARQVRWDTLFAEMDRLTAANEQLLAALSEGPFVFTVGL